MTKMSSVPVQILIYVGPEPNCLVKPTITPLTGCLEVQVGVSINFNLSITNWCDPNVAMISDVIISSLIVGMTYSSLQNSTTNTSISYVQFNWTPSINQIGSQQLCIVAFTT